MRLLTLPEAYAREDYAKAEGIIIPVEAETGKWWPNSPRYFRTELLLGSIYRADRKYDRAEPLLRDRYGFVDSVRG